MTFASWVWWEKLNLNCRFQMFCLLRAPKSLTALNTCLNVFSTFIYTDVSHNHFFFLSCIGFFDQWLIGGLLDGCVAIWDGKTHDRCVHVYITISEHNKVPDKTLTAKRIQTILDFPFHKNENQFGVKILLNSLL